MANFTMAFPDGKRKALTLSYDDGVEQDMRLLEIMDKHGLKGTFNLNSAAYAPEGKTWPAGHIHRRMSKAQATRLFAQSGQEIAIHAAEHGDLAVLPPAAAVWQVMQDKDNLEQQFGRIIRGMAYPFGTVTDALARTLEGCGIAYARTTVSTGRFTLPENWLKLPATCHHNAPELMSLARRFVEEPVRYQPWLFYLWGHSYEFEANDNWAVIETFAAFAGGRADVWYATNIEIRDYIQAWRSLCTSADGSRIFNPSGQTLWIQAGDTAQPVAPGQQITLL